MSKKQISKEDTQAYLEIFISTLFELVPDTDVFNVRTIIDKAEPITNQFHTKQELLDIGHQYRGLNTKGGQILVGINPRNPEYKYPTRSEHVEHCPCLFADFDDIGEFTFEDLHKVLQEKNIPIPTLTIGSGHGFHVYWKLDKLLPPKEWTLFQRRLNHNIRYADEKIKDPARCMRIPGFFNTKKKPWIACVILDGNNQSHNISIFDKVLPQLPQIKDEEHGMVLPENMDYIATLDVARNYCAKWEKLDDGRKQAAYTLGCTLIHDFQLTMADAMDIARKWNKKQDNYFTAKKLSEQICCGGIYANGPKGSKSIISKRKTVTPNIGIKTGQEVEANYREIEWLWHRVIPFSHLSMLGGKKGAKKTVISESIIATLTSKTNNILWPDMTRRGDPGNVLIINLEDSPEEVALPRIKQIGGDPSRIAWMDISSDENGKFELFNIGETHKLEYMMKLQKEAQGDYPKLIVIDHLTNFLVPGRKEVGDIARPIQVLNKIARDYQIAILILYHFRKGISINDGTDKFMGKTENIMGIKGPMFGAYEWKEDENISRVIVEKSNIPIHKIRLQIEVGGYFADENYKVTWSEIPDHITDDRIIEPNPSDEEEEQNSLREDATDWVRNKLINNEGQATGSEIREWFNSEKRQLGFSWPRVTTARTRLLSQGVLEKVSNGGRSGEHDFIWRIIRS